MVVVSRMATPPLGARGLLKRIKLRNIIYLTDFSRSSDAALPFVKSIAQAFEARIQVLHILLPDVLFYISSESPALALAQLGQAAVAKMNAVQTQLAGTPHEGMVQPADDLWTALAPKLEENEANMVVLGTHGRTGLRKFVMGSTAEKVLRKIKVPVLTVGPAASASTPAERFRRILLATDLRRNSDDATAYAISLAQENEAELIFLHVIERGGKRKGRSDGALSVAEALHHLRNEIPADAGLWCRPHTLVEMGPAGQQIVRTAKQRKADLVVIGIRETKNVFASTHLEIRTAHEVIAHAPCPVLCVPARTL